MPRLCRDKEEMRNEYLFIKRMEKEIELKQNEIKACEMAIKYCKDGIRNTYKEEERFRNEPKWECYNREDSWDSRHMWETYDFIFTKEDEEEYRECNTWRIYSPYDCTGQWFTRYISIFRIPEMNKTVVYHMQGLDV